MEYTYVPVSGSEHSHQRATSFSSEPPDSPCRNSAFFSHRLPVTTGAIGQFVVQHRQCRNVECESGRDCRQLGQAHHVLKLSGGTANDSRITLIISCGTDTPGND
jgi:hypothetical protein